jgi:hypothetical protein
MKFVSTIILILVLLLVAGNVEEYHRERMDGCVVERGEMMGIKNNIHGRKDDRNGICLSAELNLNHFPFILLPKSALASSPLSSYQS